MNSVIRRLIMLSELLDKSARSLASISLLLMVACIFFQIIARYLFAEPPGWTEELARIAMIWAGFTGATVACRRRLDPVLLDAAKIANDGLRKAARWTEAAAILVFCIPILIATPQFLSLHTFRSTESLQVPSVLVVAIIPICLAIICFHALVRLVAEHRAVDFLSEEENA